MFDTHAHLNFPQLSGQIDKIMEESRKAGLTGIIIASSNLEDSKKAVELAKKYPVFLFASVGIHPQKTDPGNHLSIEEQLLELENLIKTNIKLQIPNSKSQINPNDRKSNDQNLSDLRDSNLDIACNLEFGAWNLATVVAIGETGLDFSEAPPGEENRSKEDQYALFNGQIMLARKYNLPLIVHARDAVDEVINKLRIYADYERMNTDISGNQLRGVFHCYAGGKKRVQKVLNLPGRWYFGFDGNLTYDEGLQAVLKLIPEDRILIETDSPFLSPAPHRGETNTPANVVLVQRKINEIFGENLTEQIENNTGHFLFLY